MVAHPHSDSLSTIPGWNRNLKVLVFEEKGKTEYPKKNLSEQRREPTQTVDNPHMALVLEFDLDTYLKVADEEET